MATPQAAGMSIRGAIGNEQLQTADALCLSVALIAQVVLSTIALFVPNIRSLLWALSTLPAIAGCVMIHGEPAESRSYRFRAEPFHRSPRPRNTARRLSGRCLPSRLLQHVVGPCALSGNVKHQRDDQEAVPVDFDRCRLVRSLSPTRPACHIALVTDTLLAVPSAISSDRKASAPTKRRHVRTALPAQLQVSSLSADPTLSCRSLGHHHDACMLLDHVCDGHLVRVGCVPLPFLPTSALEQELTVACWSIQQPHLRLAQQASQCLGRLAADSARAVRNGGRRGPDRPRESAVPVQLLSGTGHAVNVSLCPNSVLPSVGHLVYHPCQKLLGADALRGGEEGSAAAAG